MADRLSLDLVMTPEDSDGGIATLGDMPGTDLWRGYRMPAGPTALPVGPLRYLSMREGGSPADAIVPAGYWRWSGIQRTPGRRAAPAGAGAVTLLMMDVDPADDEEFNAWYDTEHLPHVNLIPGILIARRFVADIGTPRYLQMFHAAEPEVTQRADFWRYRFTPWTQRMWPKVRNVERFLFQPVRPAPTPG